MTKCGTPSCELVRPAPHTTIAVLTGEHDVSTLSRLRQALDPLNRDSGLLGLLAFMRTAHSAITADRARQ
jgi:hypothetical protein